MSEEAKHEIVIVRRGGHGDHDEHHGGVWKIAFADFMTAMMAFFLVMWLVSANDKTRASIAHYFNPVRLVDATTRPGGLHDVKKNDPGLAKPDKKNDKPAMKDTNPPAEQAVGEGAEPDAGSKANDEKKSGETAAAKEKRLDNSLRTNPFVALAEIAGTKGPGDVEPTSKLKSPEPASGRRGGEAYRDPFAPPAPQQVAEAENVLAKAGAAPSVAPPASAQPASSEPPSNPLSKGDAEARTEAKDTKDVTRDSAKAVLAALKGPATSRDAPKIDVRHTSEGLLVSLTDTPDASMFSTGSAVPSRKVVLLVEKIGKLLKTMHGTVVVRGFTDNKPYRSSRYDNWHLSLDRAQVTHYMLVRGGLDDARFGHVEGYADRSIKNGLDPASPLNRRIEILLKDAS